MPVRPKIPRDMGRENVKCELKKELYEKIYVNKVTPIVMNENHNVNTITALWFQ